MPDYTFYPSSAAPPVQPHTRTTVDLLMGKLASPDMGMLKSRGLATGMDRAPAARWLPATVAGGSKEGIRMPDYLYPSAPQHAPCATAHAAAYSVDLFGRYGSLKKQRSASRHWMDRAPASELIAGIQRGMMQTASTTLCTA